MHKALINLVKITLIVASFSIAAAQSHEKLIKIGVLAYRGKDKALNRWHQTADYLSNKLNGYVFEIIPLNLPELTAAIKDNRLSFTLTNPGHYVLLESKYGISRIVTMQTQLKQKIRTRFGAVIFTRSDNNTIYTLEDLIGKSFMAVSPSAFGGFQMSWLELSHHNINPFSDFSALKFSGFPQDKIALAVYNRKIDAATVRSETLLRMIDDGIFKLSDFRILNVKDPDNDIPLSTDLYPEWPFSKNRQTSRVLAKQVAQILLSMPENHPAAQSAHMAGWTVPLDYTPVHDLMRSLKIAPYEALKYTSIEDIIKKYAPWIIVASMFFIFLIAINAYITRTNRRLKTTEIQLRDEINERKSSQKELSKYKDSLEKRVESRTTQLKNTNVALQRSQKALHDLVDIAIDTELSHKQKLLRLLETGREYYRLPIAILSSLTSSQERICTLSSDSSINLEKISPLSPACAKKIIQQNEQPLDIPELNTTDNNIHSCGRSEFKSYLATAVYVKGKAHCILEFADTQSRQAAYTQWDHNLLQVMAQWIGSEIEKQYALDDKQQHQAELYRVSRMNVMGEMAANLAHELNQPLTAASNYSSVCLRLLNSKKHDSNKLRSGLEKTIESASLASSIIRQLRDFLQKGDTCIEKIQLNNLVIKLLDLISSDINRNSVSLDLSLDKELSHIHANRTQIEQVILNFIRNAIDAMKNIAPDERKLSIKTEQHHNRIRLSVSDNGSGIDQKEKSKIFNAFYTTKDEGMGMGLSISRSIIEAHEGSIGVIPLPDRGSCFYFELKSEVV